MDKCHICGEDAEEFNCERCDEPVCEDCLEPFTLQNQLYATICKECYEMQKIYQAIEYQKEEEIRDARVKKKAHQRELTRIRYWRPENIEKRRTAGMKLRKEATELRQRQLAETISIVNDMFRGF